MTKQIELSGKTCLLVEVPVDAAGFGWRFECFPYCIPENKKNVYKWMPEVDEATRYGTWTVGTLTEEDETFLNDNGFKINETVVLIKE